MAPKEKTRGRLTKREKRYLHARLADLVHDVPRITNSAHKRKKWSLVKKVARLRNEMNEIDDVLTGDADRVRRIEKAMSDLIPAEDHD